MSNTGQLSPRGGLRSRERSISLDLAGFAGIATACLVVVLVGVPVLQVPCGLLLLFVIPGTAATAALLPAADARDGFSAVAALMGLSLIIAESLALNVTGIGLTKVSTSITAFVVSQVLLIVAEFRHTVPVIRIDRHNDIPVALLMVGLTVSVIAAVWLSGSIPRYEATRFTSVTLAGNLSTVRGVLSVAAGEQVPVSVDISNHESSQHTYTVQLQSAAGDLGAPVQVTVAPGAHRVVALGTVGVGDGCVHRFAARVTSPGVTATSVTLYLTGRQLTCASRSAAGTSGPSASASGSP